MDKLKEKMNNVMHSPKTIIVVLMILVTLASLQVMRIKDITNTYIFSARSEHISIANGVIALNYDMNLFQGSSIVYLKDDVNVTSYKIGYYLKIDGNYLPFAVRDGKNPDGQSLAVAIAVSSMTAFDIIERANKPHFFNREFRKNVEGNLYFILEAETEAEEKIHDIVLVDVTRLEK